MIDAVAPTRRDLRWHRPGQCPEAAEDRDGERARYLATFAPTAAGHSTIYAHPDAPPWAKQVLAGLVPVVHRRITGKLGLATDPPSVFLHASVEALRASSCVGPPAVAYYDGAIHVAVETTWERIVNSHASQEGMLSKSVTHEYVHHVLVSNGIGEPMWFQEGAAMTLARDFPKHYWQIWRKHPIRLHEMVSARRSIGTAEQAEVFYAQCYVMAEFLERLCLKRRGCELGELAAALKSGRATPETLFDWAVSDRAQDLVRTSRLPLWDDYAERGNFSPATMDALLHRPMPRRTD